MTQSAVIQESSSKTKRIAKNTLVLYVRMVIVMLISLYTSRVVLKALGVDDFGLYNVVGGVVGLLTFFNGTMSKSTQRFLNVSMVKGDDSLGSIFSSSITIHLIIAAVFLLLSETFGLWFLNTKVNIPEGRELAANIVFQASVVSFCVSMIIIPYSAAVIAYERMTFLALISILDAILKLGIALMLLISGGDRLILYGVLLLAITVTNFILYYLYCKRRHPVLKFRVSYNKENFKQIFSFVSWTFVGQIAVVGCNQGNIVLVNMFHSLAANAAMSVGSQVSNAINNLTTNFQTAFNPQITKSFAEGNYRYLRSLVYTTSKISFCIMFAVALPIAFNIDWVLDIWLDTVPPLSNTFAVLFMVNGIFNAISMPFNFTVLSSGRIRTFQIVTAVVFLLDLPITYALFSMGLPATTVLWVKIGVISTMFFIRVYFASRVAESIHLWAVIFEVLLPMLLTSGVSIALCLLLKPFAHSPFQRFAFTIIIELVCLVMIWFVCLRRNEKQALLNVIKRRNNQEKYVENK